LVPGPGVHRSRPKGVGPLPAKTRTGGKGRNTSSVSKLEVHSDLSLEKVYCRGCTVHLVVWNKGKGGLTDSDWNRGRLILKIRACGKKPVAKFKRWAFCIKEIDTGGELKKPGGRVDFATGAPCRGPLLVKAWFERLRNDGSRGHKRLSSTLKPSQACSRGGEGVHPGELDPCGSDINPMCQPTSCKTSHGETGKCSLLGGRCMCVAGESRP